MTRLMRYLVLILFAAGVANDVFGQSCPGNPALLEVFHQYRPGVFGTLRYRDVEFHYDQQFVAQTPNQIGFTNGDLTTLNNYGTTLAETHSNPYGAAMSDIAIIYNYFDSQNRIYNANPLEPIGFEIGNPPWTCMTVVQPGGNETWYPSATEHAHVDYYLAKPGHGSAYGNYPSSFSQAKEDSSTGQYINSGRYGVWGANSISGSAPSEVADRMDLTGTGWTRPNGPSNTVFDHELHHSLTNVAGQPPPSSAFGEMLGKAAEIVAGPSDQPSGYEFNFKRTINEIRNEETHLLLSGYLAYNFRGTNLSVTTTGLRDDLLSKWARTTNRRLGALRDLLSDVASPEFATKSYFHPNGISLDNNTRFGLLHHFWRAANYVNNSSLAEGQYGYPSAFGFSPSEDVRVFRSFDGVAPSDSFSIPPWVYVRREWARRETTLVGRYLYPSGTPQQGLHHTLALPGMGADYMVIASDNNTLVGQTQDLVVRVTPEGFYRSKGITEPGFPETCSDMNGRLHVSIIGYSVPDDSLLFWKHPESASVVVEPKWIDSDSLRGSMEFVVPNFGNTYKAALVVLSLGDGPSQYEGARASSGGYNSTPLAYRYRLSMSLRTGTFPSANPAGLSASIFDQYAPTWSPSGNELAYNLYWNIGIKHQWRIYRHTIGGSSSVLVASQNDQYRPDWSPRGDWIVYEEVSATQTDIKLFNVNTSVVQTLVSSSTSLKWPSFSPNGQRVVYAKLSGGNWGLHVIGIDGAGDVQVLKYYSASGVNSPRWSSDALKVLYTSNDSLYSLQLSSGAVSYIGGAYKTTTFDLSRGSTLQAWEQPGVLLYKEVCNAQPPTGQMPFRRLALRNPDAPDIEGRFYRTGVSFYTPRWAPDGIRVAYAADDNVVGNRDIFIGHTSPNHAPTFTGSSVTEMFLATCSSFQRTLTATDPDGQTVTFEGAEMPSGAGVAANKFIWSPGEGQEGTYYIVLRALDGTGGVDNRVVKVTVFNGCDCPNPPDCIEESAPKVTVSELPTEFALLNNTPNPFAGRTEIAFDVPVESPVSIEVFDLSGRRVGTVAEGTYPPGRHRVAWEATHRGRRLAGGVYVVKMSAGAMSRSMKVLALP